MVRDDHVWRARLVDLICRGGGGGGVRRRIVLVAGQTSKVIDLGLDVFESAATRLGGRLVDLFDINEVEEHHDVAAADRRVPELVQILELIPELDVAILLQPIQRRPEGLGEQLVGCSRRVAAFSVSRGAAGVEPVLFVLRAELNELCVEVCYDGGCSDGRLRDSPLGLGDARGGGVGVPMCVDLGRHDPRPVVLIWYMYQRKIAKTLLDIKPKNPAQLHTDHLVVVPLLHSHCVKAHS